MRILLGFLLSFVLVFQATAQREQGTWQDYLSYADAIDIAVGSNKIYCATEGGLFYYDTEDNSINKYTELSDFGISLISYSDDNDVLVVVYSNGNIDLIYDSEVVNLSDLKRKTMSADKAVNNISFYDNAAYLSCGFGIVVVNLSKQEIKDTYYIGEDGASVAVNDVAFFNNSIYAATDEGILVADINGVDLLDYHNWNLDESIPNPNSKFSQLEVHGGDLIVANSEENKLYGFDGNTWDLYYQAGETIIALSVAENYLLLTSENNVVLFDINHSLSGKINSYPLETETVSDITPKDATISSGGIIWIADYDNALVKVNGENFESLYPTGPMDNDVFFLTSNNNSVWVTPGGRTDAWANNWAVPRFQRFKEGEWTNFSIKEIAELSGVPDIVCLAVDPSDENHFFVGSWGGGLLEFRNDEFVTRYTNKNSPLETALPQEPDAPYVRIGGLAFDSYGNLWVTNSAVTNNLHKISSSGDWESFSMSEITDVNVGQLVVTENNDKWILVPRGNDAYVVNDSGDDMQKLLVTSYFSNSTSEYYTRMNDVYSIAEDEEGAIWIGTSKGVAVYNSPSRIWTTETLYASQPGLDLGDGIYYPLLEDETVTAIAVDGANRKWLGTKSSGVYLVSESGEEELLHFTAENSSLLSNNIKAITINQKNGEVFFGTDEGLISYQGEATGGNDSYSDVYVYPNPVRETYSGNVTITGLIPNTDIKITDISGNLVFKTTSLGGQAIWDGKNLNGNRVKTGVYLVFCNDEYGEETHITKLLFIN